MTRTALLKHKLLEEEHYSKYISENKKVSIAIESLLLAEQGMLFQKNDKLLAYQNTNKENYPSILKDFLFDVNKSASFVLDSIILISKDEVISPLLSDSPILAGHYLEITDDGVLSKSIDYFASLYFNKVKEHYQSIIDLFEDSKEKKCVLGRVMHSDILKVLDILPRALTRYENMHPLMAKSQIGKVLEKVNLNGIKSEYPKAAKGISEILSQEDSSFHYLYFSINLYDEKITNKKDLIYPMNIDDTEFYFISKEGAKSTSRSSSVSYNFILDPSMSFYLKKNILESVTQKEILPLMSSVKDYLSRDQYREEMKGGNRNYNAEHPFNIQSESKGKFETSTGALWSSFLEATNLYQSFKDKHGDEQLSYSEWKKMLRVPKILYGYSVPDDKLLSYAEIGEHLILSARVMLERIFHRSKEEDEEKGFLKTIHEEGYIYSIITNILDYIYKDDPESTNALDSSLFGYRERSTFHTELKDSIVVDFRGEDEVLNAHAMEMKEKEERFGELMEAMRSHPYHNYYEIDKDFFKNSSKMDISYLIDYLGNASLISPSVSFRCGLKFRKLGNYKASGIYFSHTKTMGIDFRKGGYSYVHELAHHIDLNGYKKGREKLIDVLYGYFKHRVTSRVDYYLRGEELIARGAEVAMVLMAANYKEHANLGLSSDSLIEKLKGEYASSKQYAYMKSWEQYFPQEMYVDIESCIKEGETRLLDVLMEYFESYWSSNIGSSMILEYMDVNYFSRTDLKYPASHRSYDYYHCKIYKITHEGIDNEAYLNNLITPLLSSISL